MAELVDASVSKTDEVMLVPVRSRPWVQIRLNRKLLITNACDFFFLFFNPFVKTHDEQIGQTTMSSLRQVPDFLHGYFGALLTNKYPPLSRLVVYCAGSPNWNECRNISQNVTTCHSCAQYRYLLLLWLITRKSFIVTKQVCANLEDGRRNKIPTWYCIWIKEYMS